MKRIRIGLIKELPVKWSVEDNWRNVERLVRLHSRDGVDVFVTPECFLDGCAASEGDWTPQRFDAIAQRIEDSPYVEALCRTAATHSTHIVCGLTERIGERYHNCGLLVGRNGEILGKYQKTHLQEHDLHIAPGSSLPAFALDCAEVGILTFSEWRWPEAVRSLRLLGSQVVFLLGSAPYRLEDEWGLRTRAAENGMFVCLAHPEAPLIIDPAGRVVSRMHSSIEDVLIHDLDLDTVSDTLLDARRTDLYGNLSEPPSPQ
jgi:predicted amidohydrolase